MIEVWRGSHYLAAVVRGYFQLAEVYFDLGFDFVTADIIGKDIEDVPHLDSSVIFQSTSCQSFIYFGLYLRVFLEILVSSVKDDVAGATGCNQVKPLFSARARLRAATAKGRQVRQQLLYGVEPQQFQSSSSMSSISRTLATARADMS